MPSVCRMHFGDIIVLLLRLMNVLEVFECLLVDGIDLLHLHPLYANALDQSCEHTYLVHERRDMWLKHNIFFVLSVQGAHCLWT